jgi:predicted nucleic acid-binding protein
MNKQRHRRRSQGGTSPETTPQTGSGVANFSVSEVVQFSMSVDKLCSTVLQISQVHRINVYDATYLALALRYGAMLLTADQQLAGAAERTGCGG